MDRVHSPDNVPALPAYSANGTAGYFTDANGGTTVPAQWCNQLTEELRHVVVESGQTPSATSDTQLIQAIAGALCIKSANYEFGTPLTTASGQAVIACEASTTEIGSVGRNAIIASYNARGGPDWAVCGGYSETPLAPGDSNLTWIVCAADAGWAWFGDSLKVGGLAGRPNYGGTKGVFEVSQSDGFVRVTDGPGGHVVANFDFSGNLNLNGTVVAPEAWFPTSVETGVLDVTTINAQTVNATTVDATTVEAVTFSAPWAGVVVDETGDGSVTLNGAMGRMQTYPLSTAPGAHQELFINNTSVPQGFCHADVYIERYNGTTGLPVIVRHEAQAFNLWITVVNIHPTESLNGWIKIRFRLTQHA